MALTLRCRITIGGTVFENDGVIGVRGSATWKQPGAVAVIQLPNLKGVLERKKLAVGMSVKIELGSVEKGLRTEFTGWVRQINPNIPLEIICEDNFYLLRKTPFQVDKTNVRLADVLDEVALTAGIEISGDVPDIVFTRLYLDRNVADLLELFARQGLVSYFRNGKLFVGLRFEETNLPTLQLRSDRDVVGTNLEYRSETEALTYRATAVGITASGQRVEVTGIGPANGTHITLMYDGVGDADTLRKLALSELARMQYTGYEGTITTYGYKYCEHGWDVNYVDTFYPNRTGVYRVDEVDFSFGDGGFRRNIRLGIKVQ